MNQKNEIIAFVYIILFILGISLFVYDVKNMSIFGSMGTVSIALWIFVFAISKGWQMRTIMSSCLALGYFSPMALTIMIKAMRNSHDLNWMIESSISSAEARMGQGYFLLFLFSFVQVSMVFIFKKYKGKTTFKTRS